jgi:hypothetical protein
MGNGLRVVTTLLLLAVVLFSSEALVQANSVFTVDVHSGATAGPVPRKPNDQSYDLAVIRFEDDGRLMKPTQLADAAAAITHARTNPNGAIVVLFIHGWHHSDAWNPVSDDGDTHFKAFRQTLKFITLREAERYVDGGAGGRRVVGVYVGWNGDPPNSWLTSVGGLTHLSFWNRYSTAKQIGGSDDMRRLLREVVQATKDPLPADRDNASIESPLILIGHSMGALMLQSAFLALLKDPTNPLSRSAATGPRIVEVRRNGLRVSFPDVLVALNSAADSVIHREIRDVLAAQKFTKMVGNQATSYAGPLLISATSTGDNDTKVIWRGANLLHPGRTTDGHDAKLFTHHFASDQSPVTCNPRGFVDFGQNWHCLRAPDPPNTATPAIAIDLPIRERSGRADVPPFARYVLRPLKNAQQAQLTWVFQVSPEIVADHNDIFNSRASSLMLAMIQMSGAIMSLAHDWDDTFES